MWGLTEDYYCQFHYSELYTIDALFARVVAMVTHAQHNCKRVTCYRAQQPLHDDHILHAHYTYCMRQIWIKDLLDTMTIYIPTRC